MSNDAALNIATRFVTLPLAKRKLYLQKMHAENISPANLPVPCTQSLFDRVPVSFAQQRQWFLWQMDPQSTAYNLAIALRLQGALDIDALRGAFQALIVRHQTLRTTFSLDDEQLVQVIHPPESFEIDAQPVDVGAAPETDLQIKAWVESEARTPFDLERQWPTRVRLLRLHAHDHVLIITLHHIATDGWSMQVLVDELIGHYAHACTGEAVDLAPLPIQYADYAIWQRHWMEAGEQERQLAYWRAHLGDEHPVLELPSDRPRPATQRFEGASLKFELESALADALKQQAQQQGVTLFTLLLASFQTLLHRYSGQDEVRVGIPIANRNRVETERLIGFFVNTQVLKAQFDSSLTFTGLLSQMHKTTLAAQAHQDLPFEQLVEALHPERSLSHSPLFQVMYNHQAQARGNARRLQGLQVEGIAWERQTAQFDLTLNTVEHEHGIAVELNYATALFEASTVARMASHLTHLLEAIAERPWQLVAELPMLGQQEHRQIVEQWNSTQASYPADQGMHQLIEAQARATPQAPAVLFGEDVLTYRQLNQRANRLAHALRDKGVGPDVLVGIAVERSLEMVVGLLAVLKAGGAYVPFDPDYPAERLAYMMEDSGIRLLLTQTTLRDQLPIAPSMACIVLDDADEWLAAYSDVDPVNLNVPADLAYVIYTSGSTGRPKGAGNTHQALVNRLWWMQKAYGLDHGDTVLQKTPFSFDVSVWEFFWPLFTGARLAVARPGDHRDPERLVEAIRQHRVTTLHFVPSMLQAFMTSEHVERCETLKRVVCSGEALPADLSEQVLARLKHVGLFNLYGPTEAAIDVTHWTCQAQANGSVPIGTPIDNLKTHVLSSALLPVPQGVAGELYLGGVGLARGYHRRPGLTAERFVPDPLDRSEQGGARLYRTGDLARYRSGGVIEYAGRLDHQVKIRGLRIELGEIESKLLEHDSVREAVVIDIDGPGGKQLAAYLVVDVHAGELEEHLRRHLKATLPDYMVPSHLLFVDALPLTPNGKLDRKALPRPDVRQRQKHHVAPRTPLEARIAAIWADVLKLERVGATDNFFELGGDSIISIQVVSRARREGMTFTPKQLFQLQTVEGLAAVVAKGHAPAMQIDQGAVQGRMQLLPIHQAFFNEDIADRHHWNQALLLKPGQALDSNVLDRALQALLAHHDALRVSFQQEDGSTWSACYRQIGEPAQATCLWQAQLQHPSELQALCDKAQRSLDLQQGPLLRAVLADLPDGNQRLLLVIHHLAVDGVSWRILLEDLQAAYRQEALGQTISLPAKTSSVKAWAEALQTYANSEVLRNELPYWQALSAVDATLPCDNVDGSLQARHAAVARTRLDERYTRQLLQDAPGAYRTQVNDLLLTALARVIARWTKQEEVLVQLEGHGREELCDNVDLSRTVGWFTSMFPVRLSTAEAMDTSIKTIKEQLRAVPNKGLGFGALRYLGDQEASQALAELAPPRITFNYLGQFDASFDEPAGELGQAAFLMPAAEHSGASRGETAPLGNWLSIDGQIFKGELSLNWTFSQAMFEVTTVERLAAEYARELQDLIDHCVSESAFGRTPSDFPLCNLNQAQLDALPVPLVEIEDIYPLSPMQQGMLFHSAYEQTGDYINQMRVDVQGLDAARFDQAWQAMAAQHDVLRANFITLFEQPLQIIREQVQIPCTELDWSASKDLQRELCVWAEHDRRKGFDLQHDPLLRITAIRTGPDSHHLIYTSHHILMDGWSNSQLLGEVLQHYAGQPAERKPGRYRDYIQWLQGQGKDRSEAFWREQLQDLQEPTHLAQVFRQGKSNKDSGYADHYQVLDWQPTLSEFARERRVTVNTLVQAAWLLLLQRYTGQECVAVGATVAGRPADVAGAEHQLGLFINTLPVINRLQPTITVEQWVTELQGRNLALREHEHTALYDVQRLAGVAADGLFDTLLVFENYPVSEALREGAPAGLRFIDTHIHEQTNYPLTLAIGLGAQLSVHYSYDRSSFSDRDIEQIAGHFANLLHAIIQKPQRLISELPMLGVDECRRIVEEWNHTTVDYPGAHCVHQLFEAQVLQRPEAVALVFAGQQLTYRQLNVRANGLAHRLRERGVGPDVLVGIALERSVDMVVGLLAILKAGGAYVPLDPEYPQDRLAYMIEDSRIQLLLTHRNVQIPACPHIHTLMLDELDDWLTWPADNLAFAGHPGNLAYVIYTSGSTGKPKGAANTHEALLNRLFWMQDAYALRTDDKVLQKTPFSFDVSVWEFFWPLMTGARLVLAQPGEHRDPALLMRLIKTEAITTLHFVPSMLQAFISGDSPQAACTSLRQVMCSGEALPLELQRSAMALLPGTQFYNLYGPTEAAIDVTHWHCVDEQSHSVPIGRPIANLHTYILDDELNPVPAPVTGELYLGGIGLARGYHERAMLTAERFCVSPFGDGERLYRTGDLARQREDGVIEYAGRIDHQVKIRGLRIELGEIEASLLEHPAVKEAAVLAIDLATGKQLVAFVVIDREEHLNDVKAVLARRLPDYMVPYHYVLLDSMPLSPNGKLDRKRLPMPELKANVQQYSAPSNEVESALALIWQEVLQREQVGIHDNFFELGGDSIVSIRIASKARLAGYDVSPKRVFEHQTIAQLAATLERHAPVSEAPVIARVAVSEEQRALLPLSADVIEDVYPLSPMQQGMLFHSIEEKGEGLYIHQVSLPVTGLKTAPFIQAWAAVTARHEVLRTSFHWAGLAEPLQVVHTQAQMPVREIDLQGSEAPDATVQALAHEEWLNGFDLTQAPLHRLLLVKLDSNTYHMTWTSHHILMDGWSTSRLFAEVMQHYAGKPVSGSVGRYGDFIAWLQAQDKGRQEAFWRESLAGVEPTLLAQTIHPRHSANETGHNALYSRWDKAWTTRLQDYCRNLRVTPNTVIQGAWLLLLQRYTAKSAVTFGATVAGRPESLPGADSTLGLFINTLPVSQELDPTACLEDWLRDLQAYNLELRNWSHTPLNDVQRWSGTPGQTLFDSIIVFENYPIDESMRESSDAEVGFGESSGVGVTNVPMDLAVHLNDTLSIEYLYLRNSFSEAAVQGIRQTMEATLDAMLSQPRARLGNLQCLLPAQLEQAAQWGAEPATVYGTQTLAQSIAAQAQRQPDAVALVCAERSLTYAELERQAEHLCTVLRLKGAAPEVIVGVALERSLELVVTLLAIMKTGAAYVPLDLEYPADRLAWMIEDSGMQLLVTRHSLLQRLPSLERVHVIEPVADQRVPQPTLPPAAIEDGNLAYLIYTSGSTGKPKGVAVAQGPLSRHCQAIVERYEMGPSTRELHFMSFAFDGAQERWLSTLLCGGTLVIRDGDVWTVEQTLQALWRQRITIACFPPAYLKQLAESVQASGDQPPPVQIYCFGGDAVPEQTFEQVRKTLKPTWMTNGYGPTETVVTPLLWKVPGDGHCAAAYAPIGHAVGRRSLRVLDDELNPLPPGFAGELMIGGDGVARGYHGRPALTAERFVPDPLGKEGARLYRSGDLVRRRDDGVVDYVGRIDNQVKIRGFRIELGEVEAALRTQDGVRDAVVVVHETSVGKQLIGYVVGEDTSMAKALRAVLAAQLPEYMVPSQIIVLPSFPVTPNGKLDRKRLPDPVFESSGHVAPRNEQERLLAQIWEEVLQVDPIGITDNFFELGGDSILSLQVVSRVRNHPTLDMELKLRDVLRYQTIEAIVGKQEQADHAPVQVADTGAVDGLFNLLPIQEWMFAEALADPAHFNQALMLKPRIALDLDALDQALACIEAHHDALRLRFVQENGRWLQRYLTPDEARQPLLQREQACDEQALMTLANQAQRSLRLVDGPVWRAVHVQLADGQARLLLVIHHLVMDGVSWRVLLEDLQRAYQACTQGDTPALPARTTSYRAWAELLRKEAASIGAQQGDWWLAQLEPLSNEFPCDNPRGRNEVSEQAAAHLYLTREKTAQLLKQAPAAYRTQVNDILLAALARVLCRWSGEEAALIQLEGHGREDLYEGVDLSRTVGWFTSMFPVRLAPGEAAAVGESILATQRQLAAVPDKGVGYGVLRYLGEPRMRERLAAVAQPRVTFNYFGQFDQSFDKHALLEPAPEGSGDCYSPRARLANWLEIVGQVYDGSLSLRCVYSKRRYRAQTIDALMESYREELELLIDHCLSVTGAA